MTSSRSSILRSSLVILAALILWVGRADAGRKRLVVLELDGPKAEKFHSDLVKLLKKHNTVLSTSKWRDKAEDLDATAVTDKNVKKLARKLKIDGVITGRIEKRRGDYIIALQLRSGSSGRTVGRSVRTKSGSARLDAQSQRDIKDELLALIDELESNRGGDDEDEEEVADDEDDEDSRKSGFSRGKLMRDDDEDKGESRAERRKKEKEREKEEREEKKRLAKEEEDRKREDDRRKADDRRKQDDERKKKDDEEAFARRNDRSDDEEDDRGDEENEDGDESDDRRSRKRTASRDDEDQDDDEGIEEDADTSKRRPRDLSPAGRAIDAVVGLSFTARKLQFAYAADLAKPPPGYKQSVPVAGGMLDVTAYPLAFTNTKGIIRGIGLNVLYDQVLVINSQKRYADNMGVQQVADLKTTENRWAIGPVLRYPMGKLVIGGSLTYGRQQFSVQQKLPNDEPTDIPNVHYTMISPAAFVRYPATSKIVLNADAAFHAVTNTGQIQKTGMDGYGAATVSGFEVEGGGDYMVTKNLFARASVRFESISLKFKGDPTSQSNVRDGDPEQDVTGAKDTYFGGSVSVGYVY